MCRLQRDDLLEAWTTIFRDRIVIGETPSEVRHKVRMLCRPARESWQADWTDEQLIEWQDAKHAEGKLIAELDGKVHDFEPSAKLDGYYDRHWSDDPKHYGGEHGE